MTKNRLYVAGIGASAGGHQALKDFFSNIPEGSGIAFCVVTHLLRGHQSILDIIISRFTNMRVRRMKGNDIVQPDTVYVMPENMKAYIRNGCLHLKRRADDELVNRTVDEFLISLAEDQKENAIGIIFSGMGDDGALGVQHIHELGGIVLVQDPQSTAFKSMPENAIKQDHPDQILSPALLAKTIVEEIARKNVEIPGE
jgi:two-component system, chemotaxis family, protein-glutamate methylesterase/glutaminase